MAYIEMFPDRSNLDVIELILPEVYASMLTY